MILLRTIHGSHLYGLNHAGSDTDFYTVVTNRDRKNNRARYAKQTINDSVDSLMVDLSTFMRYCHEAVPQALECMFSNVAEIDLISDFRHNFYVDTVKAFVVYRRTIVNFLDANDYKRTRHALRLTLNLRMILECGNFNPTLTMSQIELVNDLADDRDRAATWICERIF